MLRAKRRSIALNFLAISLKAESWTQILQVSALVYLYKFKYLEIIGRESLKNYCLVWMQRHEIGMFL